MSTDTATANANAGAPEGASAEPAASISTPAPRGSFIANALSELSKVAGSEDSSGGAAPSSEEGTTPAAPAKPVAQETPNPQDPPAPAKTEGQQSDDEDAKAEADIKRETANMPPSQRAAFTKLRYEARDLKRQLKAAMDDKAKAVTPAENTEANAELERLRTEYDAMKTKMGEYEKEAFVTRLEATDLYQNEIVRPRESVATNISEIAKRYSDIDQESVVAAVRTADPDRISRVTADMSEFDRYRFYNLVEQYQAINNREMDLRANSKESLENIYRTQREQREAKMAEEKTQWEKSVGDVWKQLEEDFPVLAPVEGDADWNSKLEQVKSFASPDRFEKLTIRERAEALHRAAAFPVLVSELETALEEMKSMQAKLAKYEGATPGVSAEGSGSGGAGPLSGTNFVENALAELRKIGAS